jgi:hypothetical protein
LFFHLEQSFFCDNCFQAIVQSSGVLKFRSVA